MMKIINAGKTHLGGIMKIENENFGQDAFSVRQFKDAIKNEKAFFLTCLDGEEICGYSLGFMRKTAAAAGSYLSARVYSIAVSKNFQGRKIGEKLLLALEEKFVNSGCKNIYLEVRPDNHAALGLYKKHGYREVGRVENYYHDGSAALKFKKEIGI